MFHRYFQVRNWLKNRLVGKKKKLAFLLGKKKKSSLFCLVSGHFSYQKLG